MMLNGSGSLCCWLSGDVLRRLESRRGLDGRAWWGVGVLGLASSFRSVEEQSDEVWWFHCSVSSFVRPLFLSPDKLGLVCLRSAFVVLVCCCVVADVAAIARVLLLLGGIVSVDWVCKVVWRWYQSFGTALRGSQNYQDVVSYYIKGIITIWQCSVSVKLRPQIISL
ncbi:hypothetical protein F2Q69_00061897 [Brassica cretica]|uniref:Uncharacterized protein n=1 Tax=Brassica cretica TaxID=69181 RepID=A0A8S9REI0_BRACR|nr:hypothetical protein F2Q69_00061897 [Brassica cretica]